MDLINRQDVLDKAILIPIAKIVTEDKVIYRKVVFVDDIEKLPSAERVGHWIIQNGQVECSECGEPNRETDYCPNCGARMVSEDEH